MRRIALVAALLAAPAAHAQVVAADIDVGSLRGSWEIGLLPTARHMTADVGRRHLFGFGVTPTIGYHITPAVALEVGLLNGWIPQVPRRTTASLNFLTPTASVVAHFMATDRVRPYILAGAAFENVMFQRPPNGAELVDQEYVTGNFGAGFKYSVRHNAALRAEMNTQTGQGKPSIGGMLGFSWYPGARRPAPIPPQVITQVRVDTIRMPAPPARVDTVRVTPPATPTASPDAEMGTVLFDYDRSEIRADARSVLEGLVPRLTTGDARDSRIRIIGHTDPRGSVAYNLTLGQARARAVRDFLVARGVSADRIIWASAGEENPVSRGTTEADHQRNRRAVILRTGG